MSSIYFRYLIIFAFTLIVGKIIIPFLKKLKIGQSIREEGPSSHIEKSGTPTIGGLIFIIPIIAAYLLDRNLHVTGMKILISGFVIFASIGFLDDYIKVVKKHNLGLRAYQKFGLQFIGTVFIVLWLFKSGLTDNSLLLHTLNVSVDMGVLKGAFLVIFLLATVNSVNLTDGLDGLSTSVTLAVSMLFLFYSTHMGEMEIAQVVMLFVAGLSGFLVFNKKPAKVFMGDTGSLALGAYVGITAIIMKIELLFLLYGFIYFIETLSVILQVASYKIRKKRIFRMSPIHHHFELVGWSEKKIVFVFTAVTGIAVLAAGLILSKGAIV